MSRVTETLYLIRAARALYEEGSKSWTKDGVKIPQAAWADFAHASNHFINTVGDSEVTLHDLDIGEIECDLLTARLELAWLHQDLYVARRDLESGSPEEARAALDRLLHQCQKPRRPKMRYLRTNA